jgi:hypothetical protein
MGKLDLNIPTVRCHWDGWGFNKIQTFSKWGKLVMHLGYSCGYTGGTTISLAVALCPFIRQGTLPLVVEMGAFMSFVTCWFSSW